MPKNYGLRVRDQVIDATTGHHSVTVAVEETDPGSGSKVIGYHETIGIDARALDELHGGDIEKFVVSHKPRLVRIHQLVQRSKSQLKNIKGKTL